MQITFEKLLFINENKIIFHDFKIIDTSINQILPDLYSKSYKCGGTNIIEKMYVHFLHQVLIKVL